jgi:hypothetical protein
MGRKIGGLTALSVAKEKTPGLYADGGGLYLNVKDSGAKSWVFRYSLHGTRSMMGLGSLNALSLAEARLKAADCRRQLSDKVNPLGARKAVALQKRLEEARSQTFKQCAEAYIEAHRSGWRNAKHAAQWTATLTTYAFPLLGNLPVQDIDVALVMRVLEPVWNAKPETASRVRGRLESIIDWATVRGYRQGENPARWPACPAL